MSSSKGQIFHAKLGSQLLSLPIYASDSQTARVVLGDLYELWPDAVRGLERKGLPRGSRLFPGLRYLPALLNFFDQSEGLIVRSIGSSIAEDGPEDFSLP